MNTEVEKTKKTSTKRTEALISIGEMSEAFGMTASFIRKAVKQYGLPYYKIGRMLKFRVSEIEVWLIERHKGKAS